MFNLYCFEAYVGEVWLDATHLHEVEVGVLPPGPGPPVVP